MKHFFLTGVALLLAWAALSQSDTTIYKAVTEMPRLLTPCETLDTTMAAKQQCANQIMLQYVYERVVYPQAAIQQGIEGTAVITFVVEKDGSISGTQIARDLGGGTGPAALSVVLRMQEDGIRWVPGQMNGQPVRVQFNLPIRFKLEDPDPFVLVGRDTVYTQFDEALSFKGGVEALQTFLADALTYPASGNEDCRMGQIDIQVLVESDGNVRILDVTDYNDLGFDFWYAAIDAATSTYGQWNPARFQGRAVNSAFDLSLSFTPVDPGCAAAADAFVAAHNAANEGVDMVNEGRVEEGLAKISAAVAAFPDDAQLRSLRGQVYLSQNQLSEACEDLRCPPHRTHALVRRGHRCSM
ncbi:MAG: TonB family protein [Saprospiraceae bacterium]